MRYTAGIGAVMLALLYAPAGFADGESDPCRECGSQIDLSNSESDARVYSTGNLDSTANGELVFPDGAQIAKDEDGNQIYDQTSQSESFITGTATDGSDAENTDTNASGLVNGLAFRSSNLKVFSEHARDQFSLSVDGGMRAGTGTDTPVAYDQPLPEGGAHVRGTVHGTMSGVGDARNVASDGADVVERFSRVSGSGTVNLYFNTDANAPDAASAAITGSEFVQSYIEARNARQVGTSASAHFEGTGRVTTESSDGE